MWFLGAIPVTKDQNDEWKFRILSTKTLVSYTLWWFLPIVVCTILNSVLNPNLSESKDDLAVGFVQFVTDQLISANLIVIPFFIPALLAYAVDKSKVDLDAHVQLTKIPKLCFFSIMFTAILAFLLYGLWNAMDNVYVGVLLFSTTWIFYSSLSMITLIVINLVCNQFISHTWEVNCQNKAEHMISGCVDIVKEYGRLKEGLSPLLLVFLSFYVVFALLTSYTGLKLIGLKDYYAAITYTLSVPNLVLTIYYIIIFCDDTFKALSANNQKLRWINLPTFFCQLFFKLKQTYFKGELHWSLMKRKNKISK